MDSILEAIGNTPLIRLRRCAPENGAELWLCLWHGWHRIVERKPLAFGDRNGRGWDRTSDLPRVKRALSR
jgi:hypothetical protein